MAQTANPLGYDARVSGCRDDSNKMQKVLICLTLGATLAAGCAGREQAPQYRDSRLSHLPFVYRMTVQQGNIVTEEMVDRLQPGMTKNQVLYLLGTPVLADIFHTDRWDYTYTIRRGHQEMETKRLTLFFEGDELARVTGDLRPDPQRAAEREPSEMIVSVPDWEDNRGLFSRTLSRVGLEPAP
jgi:outer membrane protein assembly factor BamE